MQNIRAFSAGSAFVVCVLLHLFTARAAADVMSTGATTTAPIGHHLLCLELPDECIAQASAAAAPAALDRILIEKIASINTQTNAEIEPASDFALFGIEERWAYPDKQGDCEDYVLLKRQRLHAIGIALSNLLITVVRKSNGEGHAVLTLRTDSGDFVLDNLDWRVKAWRDTPYRYVKRQSEADPKRWFAINADADIVVGALGR